MPDMRLTVLAENSVRRDGLCGEHGLAFWIELDDTSVLFDTGQGKVLCSNAELLGVRWDRAEAIVLSHGHYDHTGGLGEVLRYAGRKKVYTHRGALEPKFSFNKPGPPRDIGMRCEDRRALWEIGERIWVDRPTELGGGLHLTGPIPRRTDFEDTGGRFFLDRQGDAADPLLDDQAAYVQTQAGTVVILGCAHAGVINTLQYVKELTGDRPIHTVAGGMHLVNADHRRLDNTVTALQAFDVQRLLPCHCTGTAATKRLQETFAARCQTCAVGDSLQLAS